MNLTKIDPIFRNSKSIKFTITVKCASGHCEVLTRTFPGRATAEVFARVLRTGKCGVCEAQLDGSPSFCNSPLEATIRDPIEFNPIEFN